MFFFSVLWNFNVRDLNRSNRLFFKGRLLGLDHFCIKPVFDFIHRLFYTSKAHTPCFYLLNCHAMPTGRPFPCPLKYVLECKSTYTDFTTNPLVYSTHQNGYYLQVPDFAFPFFVFRAQKVNINQALFYLSLWYPRKGEPCVHTQTLSIHLGMGTLYITARIIIYFMTELIFIF